MISVFGDTRPLARAQPFGICPCLLYAPIGVSSVDSSQTGGSEPECQRISRTWLCPEGW